MTTPTTNQKLPFVVAGFETLAQGLDYAAKGETGLNFYSVRGELVRSLPFAELRESAQALARKLIRLGLPKGARLAIIAETDPSFHEFFFACQYAGLIPVPLPVPMSLGGKDSYVHQIRQMIETAGCAAAVATEDYLGYLRSATDGLGLDFVGTPETFKDQPEDGVDLRLPEPQDLCYIQYSSGSTSAPKGVAVSNAAAMSNTTSTLRDSLEVRAGDRCTSWLPLYHDMGLIGFCIAPTVSQMSIDYISPADFTRRSLLWFKLISDNGGTLSFSPSFGYDLCVRRGAKSSNLSYDLSSWRVAGIGGDMIRADVLDRFAETFAPINFRREALLPGYGQAENTLATTFGDYKTKFEVDVIDRKESASTGVAKPAAPGLPESERRTFVVCGWAISDHAIQVRGPSGQVLADRKIGEIWISGPSLMDGYFNNPEATAQVMSGDGWMDTGDMGYMLDGQIVVTGRSKDLIIHNGRNIWPQDIEWAVEQLPDVRSGDIAAFSVEGVKGEEELITVAQCRLKDDGERSRLVHDIAATVRKHAGVDPQVVLAPRKSLPVTSSGKLSRAGAKAKFLAGAFSMAPASQITASD